LPPESSNKPLLTTIRGDVIERLLGRLGGLVPAMADDPEAQLAGLPRMLDSEGGRVIG
jgi:hypothetical protein